MTKYVYDFAEGSKDQRDLLGGKGANLAEMTNLGLPVPPGFTISTDACRAYLEHGRRARGARRGGRASTSRRSSGDGPHARPARRAAAGLGALRREVLDARDDGDGPQRRPQRRVRARASRRWPTATSGSPTTPTGGCCRCSAPPCSASRRAPSHERARPSSRTTRGVAHDVDLGVEDLPALVATYKGIIEERTGSPFPQDPREQMDLAVRAVFDSWNTERAVLYRRQERIPGDLGTAVNIVSDGLRQRRRRLRHRRGLHPRPGVGRAGRLRRLPAERAGRGRGRRHPQHRPARRPRADRQGVVRRAARHHGDARGALPRPVRHRVHHRARQALDAADPGRQADRGGGVPDRLPARRPGPDRHGRGGAPGHRRPARAADVPAVRRGRRAAADRQGHERLTGRRRRQGGLRLGRRRSSGRTAART